MLPASLQDWSRWLTPMPKSSKGVRVLSISRILNGFPWLENTIKGTFFALLRTSLPTAKKVPFSRFWEHRFQLPKRYLLMCLSWDLLKPKKRYLFCALKHRLVKWEMDEERTILTSKYHSLETWKYLTSFSKKVPFFNFSPNRLALTKKVTILHFVLWKMNAES